MANTVVVVVDTGEILTVPTTIDTSVVVTGQGPQGPPGVSSGAPITGDTPVFVGTVQPTVAAPYIWYQKQADGSYKVFIEDGT